MLYFLFIGCTTVMKIDLSLSLCICTYIHTDAQSRAISIVVRLKIGFLHLIRAIGGRSYS